MLHHVAHEITLTNIIGKQAETLVQQRRGGSGSIHIGILEQASKVVSTLLHQFTPV
jgi:hypothetical protein